MQNEYTCKKCGGEWGFFPEDYDYVVENYPDTCPHCEMPFHEFMGDVWKDEGIRGIPYMIRVLLAKVFWSWK